MGKTTDTVLCSRIQLRSSATSGRATLRQETARRKEEAGPPAARARRAVRLVGRFASTAHRKTVASCVFAAFLVAFGVAASASAGQITPTHVRATPGVASLTVNWDVARTTGLEGFRVRWRPVAPKSRPWSASVDLPAVTRRYMITGLSSLTYQVKVRAIYRGHERGGYVTAVGTVRGEDKAPKPPLAEAPTPPPAEEPSHPPAEEPKPPLAEELNSPLTEELEPPLAKEPKSPPKKENKA